jgi:hypothetical protein
MPDETPPNVKIYDRPERKGPSPVLLALFVLIALAASFFVYRAFQAPAVPAAGGTRTSLRLQQLPAAHLTAEIFCGNYPVAGLIFPANGH